MGGAVNLHLTKQRYFLWLIFAAVMLIFFDRQTSAEFAEDEHIWWLEIANRRPGLELISG